MVVPKKTDFTGMGQPILKAVTDELNLKFDANDTRHVMLAANISDAFAETMTEAVKKSTRRAAKEATRKALARTLQDTTKDASLQPAQKAQGKTARDMAEIRQQTLANVTLMAHVCADCCVHQTDIVTKGEHGARTVAKAIVKHPHSEYQTLLQSDWRTSDTDALMNLYKKSKLAVQCLDEQAGEPIGMDDVQIYVDEEMAISDVA